jgi:hypothetical protein
MPTNDIPSIKIPDDDNRSDAEKLPGETTPPAQPDPVTSARITNVRANASGISGGGPRPASFISNADAGPADPK